MNQKPTKKECYEIERIEELKTLVNIENERFRWGGGIKARERKLFLLLNAIEQGKKRRLVYLLTYNEWKIEEVIYESD